MNIITRCPRLKELKQEVIEKYDNAKINVGDILNRVEMLDVISGKKKLDISEEEFIGLVRLTKKELATEPSLLRLTSPIAIATGTVGYYTELADVFRKRGNPKFINYLFLGDYTGKGDESIECLVAICAYKVTMPSNFFILRGCYETIGIARSYNLHDKILQRFSKRAWLEVCEMFTFLSFAATVDEKILCVHSGLSPQLQNVEQINRIPKPLLAPNRDLASDLLWASPDHKTRGWTESNKGTGFSFGQDVVQNFCSKLGYFFILRGHQVVRQGWSFSFNRKLITLCTLPNYDKFYSNDGAIMSIDDQSTIFFQLMMQKKTYQNKDNLRKEIKIGDFIYYN